MNGSNKRNRTSSFPLFIAGGIIFLCGLVLFIFDRTSPVFIYTVVMCGVGIILILFAMIRDFALKNQKMKSEKRKNNNTE